MFNSYSADHSFRQNFTFNSISGTLIKSNAKSKIVRFHMKSPMAEVAFSKSPRIYEQDVYILQVMLCGDNELIIEYITKSDYEKQLEDDKGE